MECSNITRPKFGKVEWGKDRFVATNKTDSSTAETAVSFDGKTWYEGTMSMEPGEWNAIGYTQRHVLCSKKRYRQCWPRCCCI